MRANSLCGTAPRCSVLFKYAGRMAARTGSATQLAPPQIYWEEETQEQRAVMYGPCSNPGAGKVYLEVGEDGTVRVE